MSLVCQWKIGSSPQMEREISQSPIPTLSDVQDIFKGQEIIHPGGENPPIYVKCERQRKILVSLSTYPMRYTVYDMTPKGLKWEVKDIPATPEVSELAKKNFLADKWWRGPDHPDTPEGNQKYIEFYESPSTIKGEVTFKAAAK